MTLRVFGCTFLVRDLTPWLDKLLTRAIKCTFFGYSRLYKVYQCYSSTGNWYYMFVDVTLCEDSPFLSPTFVKSITTQDVLLLLLPSPLLYLLKKSINSSSWCGRCSAITQYIHSFTFTTLYSTLIKSICFSDGRALWRLIWFTSNLAAWTTYRPTWTIKWSSYFPYKSSQLTCNPQPIIFL